MLTTELFIAILSLCLTCFALGYTIGSKSKKQTQKGRPSPVNFGGHFCTNKFIRLTICW